MFLGDSLWKIMMWKYCVVSLGKYEKKTNQYLKEFNIIFIVKKSFFSFTVLVYFIFVFIFLWDIFFWF